MDHRCTAQVKKEKKRPVLITIADMRNGKYGYWCVAGGDTTQLDYFFNLVNLYDLINKEGNRLVIQSDLHMRTTTAISEN